MKITGLAYVALSFLLTGLAQAQDVNTTPDVAPIAAVSAPAAIAAPAATDSDTATLFGDVLKKYNINPTGSVTMDYFTRYVWRGEYLDHDAVFEPGISITANGITVGYWSNWDTENTDSLNSNESDYYASYAYTIGKTTLTAGHTWYGFPGTNTSSKEFYFSAGYATFLSPTITVYHDYEDGRKFGKGNSNYYTLSLSQTEDLYKPWGITYTAAGIFGYVDHQWIDGKGWHFTPTLAVNIPINKNMTVSPTVGYNITAGALKDPNIGAYKDHVFGGVHTVINF